MIGISAFDFSYATEVALPFPLLPYPYKNCWRGIHPHCGSACGPLPGALGADRRGEHAGAVRALSFPRREVAGAGAPRRWPLAHLDIGGRIVDLAFGILFGGIVLTLALAVGLGSRQLVSRSLESHVERTSDQNAEHTAAGAGESLRHLLIASHAQGSLSKEQIPRSLP